MVDLVRGIFNFYLLSDVIVDVLMFVMICVGGKMYGVDGKFKDIKVVNLEFIFLCIY